MDFLSCFFIISFNKDIAHIYILNFYVFIHSPISFSSDVAKGMIDIVFNVDHNEHWKSEYVRRKNNIADHELNIKVSLIKF